MKQKRALILLLILSIFSALVLVSAATNSSNDPIEKAYSCLKDSLGDNCGDSSNTEAISFNLLAMAYDSKIQADCKKSLNDRKNENCWGSKSSDSCDLKSTSQAILALKYLDENVDTSIEWLLSKRSLNTGLIWYLEIDANNITECTINGNKFTIDEKKKINGQDPLGLQKIPSGYWFEIKNIDRNYSVSCNQAFITTLLYRKPNTEVLYVSSETNNAPAGDSTLERVEAYCFATGGICDYQGSLWASLALAKDGKDISPYIPYLVAMSDESSNKNYLPSAFLYMLTNGDEYYSELTNQQIQAGYWDISNRNKFYDTGLALLAIPSSSSNAESAKNYFLSIQESSGCWSDVYMNLLLYAGWPRNPAEISSGGDETVYCRDFGYYCTASTQCDQTDILSNYFCSSISDVCCKTEPQEPTCQEKGGKICSADEVCSRNTVIADDTNDCCPEEATCGPAISVNECEDNGGSCKVSCLDTEDEKTSYKDSCGLEKCCIVKATTSSGNWGTWLIIILIILVILLILAIIFRNKLKILIFKTKTSYKYEKGPGPTSRPSFPQIFRTGPPRPVPPRQAPSHMYGRSPERKTEKDKEFEETMRKLKDMSK